MNETKGEKALKLMLYQQKQGRDDIAREAEARKAEARF